jgi:type IV pilus assembly protein PilM
MSPGPGKSGKSDEGDMVNKLLERFNPTKSNQIVGVDIGANSIKVCLIKQSKTGELSLSKLANKSYDRELLHDGNIVDTMYVSQELKKLISENGIQTRAAASALSSYSVITKRITMPFLEKDALEEGIQIEVENIIPFPLKEIYFSYYIMGIDEEKEGMMNLLIVAAKKEIVDGYMETFDFAGLDLQVLDVDIFAITNLVEQLYQPKGFSVLIADVGASVTNIAIVKEANIEFTREILIGGKYVTDEIARQDDITFSEAEIKKLNFGSDVEPLLQDLISNISSEINKTVNFYVATKPRETVGRIYLTGGSARLPGLRDRIERETGVGVDFLNPFLLLQTSVAETMLEDQALLAPVALYLSTRTGENN